MEAAAPANGATIWYFSKIYNLVAIGTPKLRGAQIQVQLGFLSDQVDVTFTWDLTFLGGSVFSLLGQK